MKLIFIVELEFFICKVASCIEIGNEKELRAVLLGYCIYLLWQKCQKKIENQNLEIIF